MTTMKMLASIALCLLAAVSTATASDIYKWVDAEGNVHYGDRPVGEQSQRVDIQSRRTDPAQVAARVTARTETRAAAVEAQAAASADGPSEEERQAEMAERAKQCTTYREQQQRMANSRRLFREDENGERVYLDEAEMQSTRQKIQVLISQTCN